MGTFEKAMAGLMLLGALLTGAFHLGRRTPMPSGTIGGGPVFTPLRYADVTAPVVCVAPGANVADVTALGRAGNGGLTIAHAGPTGGNGGAFTGGGNGATITTVSNGRAWPPVSGATLPPGVSRTDPASPRAGDIQQTEENGVRRLWIFEGGLWRPYPPRIR